MIATAKPDLLFVLWVGRLRACNQRGIHTSGQRAGESIRNLLSNLRIVPIGYAVIPAVLGISRSTKNAFGRAIAHQFHSKIRSFLQRPRCDTDIDHEE
jgi:hypothetical protein